MTLQYTLVVLVSLVALTYLGRKIWRSMAGGPCAGGCGCSSKPTEKSSLISVSELTARVQKHQGV